MSSIGDLTKVDPEGTLLKGLKVGKGCIRVSKTTKLESTRIEEFIARTIELVRADHNVGCH